MLATRTVLKGTPLQKLYYYFEIDQLISVLILCVLKAFTIFFLEMYRTVFFLKEDLFIQKPLTYVGFNSLLK